MCLFLVHLELLSWLHILVIVLLCKHCSKLISYGRLEVYALNLGQRKWIAEHGDR